MDEELYRAHLWRDRIKVTSRVIMINSFQYEIYITITKKIFMIYQLTNCVNRAIVSN